MSLLVCNVEKTLVIPKRKTSFPNEEDLVYKFKAGVPLEVIDEVADSYSKTYPKIYKIVTNKEKIEVEVKKEVKEVKTLDFDPVKFLEVNPAATEEVLKGLKQSELLSLCEVLELTTHPN